jgi:two-component system LytT family response regulator
MTKISAIIIEDEELARQLIIRYLESNPQIEIIAECTDGFEALKAINQLKPDLIFLDIQMPKLNGFELLEVVDHQPLVIFSTAWDEFAIKAFEMNATDYLLKPYSQKSFEEALARAVQKLTMKQFPTNQTENILKSIDNQDNRIQRVVVKNNNQIEVIPVEQIIYIESADDYVMLHTSGGKFLKQKTMKYFEDHLDNELFIRVHRSFIIQVSHISRIEPYSKDTYLIVLKNNSKIPLSRTGAKILREKLKY